ncbi:MAG: RNA polymerase subunit sigma [Planctomycetes bacterium]|nr:RNA polymerase subunit sigma [Planctomycetota bacterium]
MGKPDRIATGRSGRHVSVDVAEPPIPTAAAVALLYDELRRLARQRLADERAGHSLQPTGLAHEAVMRLLVCGREAWHSRAHFFGAASEMMRRILVDAARRRAAGKRGGGKGRLTVSLDDLTGVQRDDAVIALGDALDGLAETDREAADLVKLRYFGGLTMVEAAAALGVSPRSAERMWAFARAWLARELGAGAPAL